MATEQSNLYKKRIRQANNSKKRQALFIAEYVEVKYSQVYQEAAELYNKINARYPKKHDLRKSVEFKNWKLVESGKPEIQPHVPRDPTQRYIYEGITIPQEGTVEEIVAGVPKKAFQLRIPLINPKDINQLGQQASDIDHDTDHDIDHDVDEVLDEGDQTAAVRYEVDDIQPSVCEDVCDETMGEIIKQLREDQDLRTIMDDIDAEFDLDGLDIGMEIEVEDRLEKELQQIM